MDFSSINWLAVISCVVIGQVFLTVWFTALFGERWAKAYGAADRKQHTREIPGYTYAIGAVCTFFLSVGLAGFQAGVGVKSIDEGFALGVQVAVCFCLATATPGYAFLKRWRTFALAVGAQVLLILILSTVLAAFPT